VDRRRSGGDEERERDKRKSSLADRYRYRTSSHSRYLFLIGILEFGDPVGFFRSLLAVAEVVFLIHQLQIDYCMINPLKTYRYLSCTGTSNKKNCPDLKCGP
jgi:hypothetical protein